MGGSLDLAAVNGPAQCVISGDRASIDAAISALQATGLEGRLLATTRAFHSRIMEPILRKFREVLSRAKLHAPSIPFLSCVTGDWIRNDEAVSADYWVDQIRRPVRFHDALTRLLEKATLTLEVGPGETLSAMVRRHPAKPAALTVLSTLGRPTSPVSEPERWLGVVGAAWCAGASLDWTAIRNREVASARRASRATRLRGNAIGVCPESRPAPAITASAKPSDWLYVPVWNIAPASVPGTAPRRWMVFADHAGFGVKLAGELGNHTVVVRAGNAFERRGESEFIIDPASRADMTLVFEALKDDPADGILHAFSLDAASSLEGLDDALAQSYFSVVALAQAVATSGMPSVQLTVLSAGGQAARDIPTNPISATVCGLISVVAEEYPDFPCRHIDLSESELSTDRAATMVAEELRGDFDSPFLAIRGGERLVCTYEPAAPDAPVVPRLRNNGVYLITGGLGGVGLALAEHLAVNYKARLVLVSRTGLPPANQNDDEGRLRHETFDRVRKAAAGLVLQSTDIAEPAQARHLVQLALSEFGCIDGVVHAAGLTGGGALQRRTDQTAREILRAKVQGTLALDAALSGVPHDFLFLCSSLTALAGTFGRADYTAANAFLDAFAANADTPARRVVAVNWDGWRETGAFARHAESQRRAQPSHIHSLLDALEPDTRGGAYRTNLKCDRWIVAEHRVGGEPMVPGTVYVELACEVARARGMSFPFAIRELTLISPCVSSNGALYTSVVESNNELEVHVESRDHRDQWRVHALARIGAANELPPPIDQDLLSLATPPDRITVPLRREFIDVGPRWSCRLWTRSEAGHHIGAFQLPETFRAETAGFVMHPALFDTLSGVIEREDAGACLPFSYSDLLVLAPLGAEVLVFATETVTGGTLHLNMRITDTQGRLLAVVGDYTLRPAALAAAMESGVR